jgi:CubicO group peptidase (beta-lactamase class C family)
MIKFQTATRRSAIGLLTAAPFLARSARISVAATDAREWTVTGMRVPKLDGLDTAMQHFMQQYGVRAGALALARGGKILFERAYTWSEPNSEIVQPASPFRLASLSKLFTAAVIYELVKSKKLSLDIKVFPWLGYNEPTLANQQIDPRLKTISMQNLIDHKGGWDREQAKYDPMYHMREIARSLGLHVAPSRLDIARYMIGEPLQFAPGSRYAYSNFGYLMLGIAAEKAKGMKYFDLVKERVIGPLGIQDVFPARTSKALRLPGEPIYEQPGAGFTPEFPDREVRMPLPYGGEGWITESKEPNGGLAATAGAVARTIGHYAVWGFGLRLANQNWARTGEMAGTACYASSRKNGLDFCFLVNTRNFSGAKEALGDAGKTIAALVDSVNVRLLG